MKIESLDKAISNYNDAVQNYSYSDKPLSKEHASYREMLAKDAAGKRDQLIEIKDEIVSLMVEVERLQTLAEKIVGHKLD